MESFLPFVFLWGFFEKLPVLNSTVFYTICAVRVVFMPKVLTCNRQLGPEVLSGTLWGL